MKTIKTTDKHFKFFVERCRHYAKVFELGDWDISFTHGGEHEGSLATTRVIQTNCQAVVYLTKEWEFTQEDALIVEELDRTAKHEMIHLLLGRLAGNGGARFVSRDDFNESEEALVVKLSKIIN